MTLAIAEELNPNKPNWTVVIELKKVLSLNPSHRRSFQWTLDTEDSDTRTGILFDWLK